MPLKSIQESALCTHKCIHPSVDALAPATRGAGGSYEQPLRDSVSSRAAGNGIRRWRSPQHRAQKIRPFHIALSIIEVSVGVTLVWLPPVASFICRATAESTSSDSMGARVCCGYSTHPPLFLTVLELRRRATRELRTCQRP